MPNWCYVTLEANASKEELQKFYDKVIVPTPDSGEGQVAFDFNTIIPMPNNIFRGNLGNAEREQCAERNEREYRAHQMADAVESFAVVHGC